jgi:hypothetical protein
VTKPGGKVTYGGTDISPYVTALHLQKDNNMTTPLASRVDWSSSDTPHCATCAKPNKPFYVGFCQHAIADIGDRIDSFNLYNITQQEWMTRVPVSATSMAPFKKLPTVPIHVVKVDGYNELVWMRPGPTFETIGISTDISTLHRIDLIEMIKPYLIEWQQEHPCHCADDHTNMRDVAHIFAAYRMSEVPDFDESCWLCSTADLVPDVPTNIKPKPFPKPINANFLAT